MFPAQGTRLRLTKGDYGIPLSLHLAPHCEECSEDMVPTDEIQFVIERAGVALAAHTTTWEHIQANAGYYTITINEDDVKALDIGYYTWRARLIRDGEIRRTLVTDTLEVVL